MAAAHKSGGTNAAFATAPARSEDRRHWRNFIQLGNWPNLAQFVIGLIAGWLSAVWFLSLIHWLIC